MDGEQQKIRDIKGYASVKQLEDGSNEVEKRQKGNMTNPDSPGNSDKKEAKQSPKAPEESTDYIFPKGSSKTPPKIHKTTSKSSNSSSLFDEENAYEPINLSTSQVRPPPCDVSSRGSESTASSLMSLPSRVGSLASESSGSTGSSALTLGSTNLDSQEPCVTKGTNYNDEWVSLAALTGDTVPDGNKDKKEEKQEIKMNATQETSEEEKARISYSSAGTIRDVYDLRKALKKAEKAKAAKNQVQQCEQSKKKSKRRSCLEEEFAKLDPPLTKQEVFFITEGERRCRKARHALERLKKTDCSSNQVAEAERYVASTKDDLETIKHTIKYRRSQKFDPNNDQQIERVLEGYRRIQDEVRNLRKIRQAQTLESESLSVKPQEKQSDSEIPREASSKSSTTVDERRKRLSKPKQKKKKDNKLIRKKSKTSSSDTSFGPFQTLEFSPSQPVSRKIKKTPKKSSTGSYQSCEGSRSHRETFESSNSNSMESQGSRSRSRSRSGSQDQTNSNLTDLRSRSSDLAKYLAASKRETSEESEKVAQVRADGTLECTCPYQHLFQKVFIGSLTAEDVQCHIRPAEFRLFYLLPSNVREMDNISPLYMAYRSCSDRNGESEIFAFPIVKSLGKNNALYHVEYSRENPRLFPDLLGLIRHYSTYSYIHCRENTVETFPVWEENLEKYKVESECTS